MSVPFQYGRDQAIHSVGGLFGAVTAVAAQQFPGEHVRCDHEQVDQNLTFLVLNARQERTERLFDPLTMEQPPRRRDGGRAWLPAFLPEKEEHAVAAKFVVVTIVSRA